MATAFRKDGEPDLRFTITAEQTREIIIAYGSASSYALAQKYGIMPGSIRTIWTKARQRGEITAEPPQFRKTTVTFRTPSEAEAHAAGQVRRRSMLTNMILRDWGKAPAPLPDNEPITDKGKVFLDTGPCDCMWQIGKDTDGAARFCSEPRYKSPLPGVARVTSCYCLAHGERALFFSPLTGLPRSPRPSGSSALLKYWGPVTLTDLADAA